VKDNRREEFAALNSILTQSKNIEDFLHQWFPSGKSVGDHFVVGDICGTPGKSFKINLKDGTYPKGYGKDFAKNDSSYGDMIAIYAGRYQLTQGEAFKQLAEKVGYKSKEIKREVKIDVDHGKKPAKEAEDSLGYFCPLIPQSLRTLFTRQKDRVISAWSYKGKGGQPILIVSRHINDEGEKEFRPWSASSNGRSWIKSDPFKSKTKGIPDNPRPVYNLHDLYDPQKAHLPIVIVEGEKCAQWLSERSMGKFVVTTWPFGCKSVSKAHWKTIDNFNKPDPKNPDKPKRNIILWPDNDKGGHEAMMYVASQLTNSSIKICDVFDQSNNWDCADIKTDQELKKFWIDQKSKIITLSNSDDIKSYVTLIKDKYESKVQENTQQVIPETTPQPSQRPTYAELMVLWAECNLSMNATGKYPSANELNAKMIFKNHPTFKGNVWFDQFYDNIFIEWHGEKKGYDKFHDVKLQIYFQEHFGFANICHNKIYRGLLAAAIEDIRNEPKDWMESLKWDGTQRIESFFHECLGTVNSVYTKAISQNFWISLIKRIYEPGCKMDHMVILEGKQGALKSTVLKTIVGEKWTVETKEDPTKKDFYMVFQGKWIVEVAELSAFQGANEKQIKNILSTSNDTYRAPYERLASDHPRQCIFVGTTNETEYLEDTTGNRRFWPVQIGEIKLDKVREIREQCFAEAVHEMKKGTKYWEVPVQAEAEQEARRNVDQWEEEIQRFMITPVGHQKRLCATIRTIATEGLGFHISDVTKSISNRIGKCLRLLNYHQKIELDEISQRTVKNWYPPKKVNHLQSIHKNEPITKKDSKDEKLVGEKPQ
jgi:predicted P-loop ATPase